MKTKIFLLFVVCMLTLCTTNLRAEIRPGTFSVSPNVGYYMFDRGQDYKNTLTYGAGLGFDFTEHFGIEGIYNNLDTKTITTNTDVKSYLARIEGLLYFNDYKGLVPYIAVGAGTINFKQSGNKYGDSIADFGFGLKYFFNDYIALRADIRDVMSLPEFNPLVTVGLSFNFGGKKKAPVVEAAPKVTAPKDSDGDGVTDDMDQCPNTPAGTKVDSKGCPLDSDKDGVTDDMDQCPNTPAGTKVDSKGCPLDSDKDGVTDDKDQCPNTPAGTKVDSKGCPLDSDKDGVTDDKDQCPDTPAGIKVDSKGCPVDSDEDGVTDDKDTCPNTPKGATVDSRGCWIIKGLKFDTAKAIIKKDGAKLLDDVIPIMQANPSLKLEIQGHTDNKGADAYNKKLSTKRAQAVMDYLVKKGIEKDRLSAVGFGFDKPATSNDTEAGRAENRRVELNPIQ